MNRRSSRSPAPTIAAALEPVKPVSQRTFTRLVTSSRSSSRSAIRCTTRSARSAILAQLLLEPREPGAIALDALAADRRDAEVADHGLPSPRLAVLDELPLEVGLEVAQLELELAGVLVHVELQLVEREAAVMRRVAPPELVQV